MSLIRGTFVLQLDECKQELREKRTNVEVSDHNDRRIKALSEELQAARTQCHRSEDSVSQLTASVSKLQTKLEQLKVKGSCYNTSCLVGSQHSNGHCPLICFVKSYYTKCVHSNMLSPHTSS